MVFKCTSYFSLTYLNVIDKNSLEACIGMFHYMMSALIVVNFAIKKLVADREISADTVF